MGTFCVAHKLHAGIVGQWPPATRQWWIIPKGLDPGTGHLTKGMTRTPGWHPKENEALPQKGTPYQRGYYTKGGAPKKPLREGKGPKDPGVATPPSNGAADELVMVASTFWDFGSLSLKTLRRPLCQLLWQRQSVIVLTLRDALQ